MLRQHEKAALLRSPVLISFKSALGAHVGRGCQQTKAVNRKNGGLKQNFWAAKAPISNWPAFPELRIPPATRLSSRKIRFRLFRAGVVNPGAVCRHTALQDNRWRLTISG
jgi:hypothetical protein